VVTAGLNGPLQLGVDVVQRPLRGDHQLADDVETIVPIVIKFY
jgi:hypothetical protein